MLELLPGTGAALPGGAGVLRFGAGPDEARARLSAAAPETYGGLQCGAPTLADYPEPRHAHAAWLDGLLFQPGWNTVALFDGLQVTLAAGGPDAADRLARVEVRRVTTPRSASGEGGACVVWDGVDLFGHSAEEVLSVLPEAVPLPDPAAGGPVGPTVGAVAEVAVPWLGLRLGGNGPGSPGWSRLTLTADEFAGWSGCCPGRLHCAAGGDGLVGILY
ncbi:hypothetical protein ACFYXM_07645 [Streptomyces sp. NPDC002476]|uniref:hypothetical protein n=1 Tax=Streptomyces sp. NPDC002476 TaxID=3364648 RepID=UPI0036C87D75